MSEVKPIITEEQAAALRQTISEAFRPIAVAAAELVRAYCEAGRRAFATVAKAIEDSKKPPASHGG